MNTPDIDLNLNLPVISSLVYCESSKLDLAAIQTGKTTGKSRKEFNPVVKEQVLSVVNTAAKHTGSAPTITWRESEKLFSKNHPQCTQPGSNLDFPVISSLVQHEISALDHAATKADWPDYDGEIRVRMIAKSTEVRTPPTSPPLTLLTPSIPAREGGKAPPPSDPPLAPKTLATNCMVANQSGYHFVGVCK
uniref:Uncharacterized protein n=1 Tax=Timema shepardi TaxID=629360 RepID=A0A7R9ANM7_TIMSH|nr:unnamed protein product [Timema shepardi]